MMQANVKISALIVTYNTGAIVLECIRSILSADNAHEIEIIVVDNQSTDNTCTLILEQFPQIKLIISDKNGGFSYGNNRGLEVASGQYIAMINPDLQVELDTLSVLVSYLEENPTVGIVGPRTLAADGTIQHTARPPYTISSILLSYFIFGGKIPRWKYPRTYNTNINATEPTVTSWLQGSCLVFSKDLINQIGGMDENYFLYAEDTDLCERIQQLNRSVVYIPTTHAIHVGGTSTAKASLIRIRSYHTSPIHYFRKRGKNLGVLLLKLIFTVELLGKSLLRRLGNLVRYNTNRAEQAAHELQILREMWQY